MASTIIEAAIRAKDEYSKSLDQAENKFKKSGKSIGKSFAVGSLAVAGAATATAAALFGMTKNVNESNAKVSKFALRINASVSSLSQLEYAAKRSGVSFDDLQDVLQEQSIKLSEATKSTGTASETIKELGLNVTKLEKLKPNEAFEVIADALDKVTLQTDKTRIANDLWGESGVRMLQMTEGGAKSIRKLRQEADDLGLTLTDETAAGSLKFNKELARTEARMSAASKTIVNKLTPAFTGLVSGVADVISFDFGSLTIDTSLAYFNNAVLKALKASIEFYVDYITALPGYLKSGFSVFAELILKELKMLAEIVTEAPFLGDMIEKTFGKVDLSFFDDAIKSIAYVGDETESTSYKFNAFDAAIAKNTETIASNTKAKKQNITATAAQKSAVTGGENDGNLPGAFFSQQGDSDFTDDPMIRKNEAIIQSIRKLRNEQIKLAINSSSIDKVMAASAESRSRLVGSANSAMEDQMKSMVETGKFSADEFKKVVLEQAKAELIATAARATIQAIFQTALGIGSLAYGNVGSAKLHFASAGTFASIAGASLAAAKTLDSVGVGANDGISSNTPTNSESRSDSGGSGDGGSFDSGSANLTADQQTTTQSQNVTFVVNNPIGTEDWEEIIETQLYPAFKNLGDRDSKLSVNVIPQTTTA